MEREEWIKQATDMVLDVNPAEIKAHDTDEKLRDWCNVWAASAMMLITQAPLEYRKHGKWERHYSRPNVYADLWWHCSACGYKDDNMYANEFHHYCPGCGAHMREVSE